MIASVEGLVAAVTADALIIDVGGVGYRVFCGPGTIAGAKAGSRLKLHTHHLVREDVQALYGFRTVEELGFFELLTTVTGVGPKVALAIVSSRPVADLQLAILQGDEAILTAVSGVGKRLAARIVLELKEKVSAAGASVGGEGRQDCRNRKSSPRSRPSVTPRRKPEAQQSQPYPRSPSARRSRIASRRRSASSAATEVHLIDG